MAANPEHTRQQKKKVIELLIQGCSPTEVEKEYNLDRSTLFNWLLWYVQAYYNEAEYIVTVDDQWGEYHAEMHAELTAAEALQDRRRAGGKIRARQKQAEAENGYWRFVRNELEGDGDALEERELPIRLQLMGWEKLPKNCQRELEWIRKFIKRLRLYKKFIDDELEENPGIDEEALVARVQKRGQEIPKTLRRDAAWITSYVRELRMS